MKNIMIRSGSPSIQKKKKITTEYSFSTLVEYPIPKEAIRFPRISTTDGLIYSNNNSPSQIHDIINANLMSLVPNIDIGYQMNMDTNDLIDWINKTKIYAESLNNDFQKRCEAKLEKLIKIEEQKEKSKVLNMDKLNKLPEDIIKHIYGYLLPETKIVLFRARYPSLFTNISKLKVEQLKKVSNLIRINYYDRIMQNLYKTNRSRCLPKNFYMKFGFTNKTTCTNNITKLIGTYENAVAHTPSDYRYFQKKALKIIQTLIYVAKTKKVLDKPYAPELEPIVPAKKQRKPRIKKTMT